MSAFDSCGLGADDGRSGGSSLGLAIPADLMPADLMPADLMPRDIMPGDFRHSGIAAVPAILVTDS